MNYSVEIYSFIKSHIGEMKYIYSKDINWKTMKYIGETRYHMNKYPDNDWIIAFDWVVSDVFNSGCEPEVY